MAILTSPSLSGSTIDFMQTSSCRQVLQAWATSRVSDLARAYNSTSNMVFWKRFCSWVNKFERLLQPMGFLQTHQAGQRKTPKILEKLIAIKQGFQLFYECACTLHIIDYSEFQIDLIPHNHCDLSVLNFVSSHWVCIARDSLQKLSRTQQGAKLLNPARLDFV